MFGLGTTEILIILLVAVIFVGPSKLPDLAKALGRGMAQLRKATDDLKDTVESDKDLKLIKDSFQDAADGVQGMVSAEYDKVFDDLWDEESDKDATLDDDTDMAAIEDDIDDDDEPLLIEDHTTDQDQRDKPEADEPEPSAEPANDHKVKTPETGAEKDRD